MRTIEKTGRSVDEAIAAGLQELGVPSDKVKVEIIDEGKGGFLGIGARPSVVRLTLKESRTERVESFVTQICEAMSLDATVRVFQGPDHLQVEVIGAESGVLIGHHGQTLDALQYLCNLVATKAEPDGPRVLLDVEGYRKRRAETLTRLATRLAERVKRTGEPMVLEPMSAHERRVIHLALQDLPGVMTTSEGEEPFRRVVIQPKR
jgi:spoIIIJ-associated protein